MKKITNRIFPFASLLFLLLATTSAYGDLVLTSGITETEFRDTFADERVWYAQFQPGGGGTGHPNNEFEIGGDVNTSSGWEAYWIADAYYLGDLPENQNGHPLIYDEANNPFEISISATAFLSASFNGTGTPGGSVYGVTDPFNTIWVGLELGAWYDPNETLDVLNHAIDTGDSVVLPSMHVMNGDWVAFKFHFDDMLSNIPEFTLTGDLHPDMRFGGAINEDWLYTVFGSYDSAIIPEPGSFGLTICGLVAASIFTRIKRKAQQDRGGNALTRVPHD